MGSRSGRPPAAREGGWKPSMACSTDGPHHQASPGSVGALTRFWPVGPTAGSQRMALSLKPQSFRKGSSRALQG